MDMAVVTDSVVMNDSGRALISNVGNVSVVSDAWIMSRLSPDVDYLLGIYFLLTLLSSLVLNMLVLLTLARRPQPIVPLEVYIINMCICHVIHVICAFPLVVVACFRHGWYLNPHLCTYESSVVFFCGCASIFNLTTMSITRYLKTCHPKLDIYLTRKMVLATLVVAYTNAAVWAFGPLLGWGSYAPEPYGISCTLDWAHLPNSYSFSMFIIGFLIPTIIIGYCYSCIVFVVCKATRKVRYMTNRKDLYVSRLAFFMCLFYILEWTPYAMLSLFYMSGRTNIPGVLAVGAPVLAKSSTWTNPVIYFLGIKRMRSDVMKYVLRIKMPTTRKPGGRVGQSQAHLLVEKSNNSVNNLKLGEKSLRLSSSSIVTEQTVTMPTHNVSICKDTGRCRFVVNASMFASSQITKV